MSATALVKERALNLRAYQLKGGTWLVLVFMPNDDGRLELLADYRVPDEAAVREVVADAERRVQEALRSAGQDPITELEELREAPLADS